MKITEFRSVQLEEFPGYDVRLMYVSKISKNNISSGGLSRYGFYGRSYGIPNGPLMLVKDFRKVSDACGCPKDSDKLMIDGCSCKIPVTLLKPRYTIITSRSSAKPDFTVIGHVDSPVYEFKVLVSEKQQRVICIYEWGAIDRNDANAPDINDYKRFLGNTIDELHEDYDSYHPYSNDLYDRFYLMKYSKCLFDFYNRLLPDTSFVDEEKLVTGVKPVTAESLYSCIKMTSSSDREIRDAAVLALASSDYSKCRNVLGYMLSKYCLEEVKSLKNKSTAVKWMVNVCNIDRYTVYSFTQDETELAKDFLIIASQGAFSFNNSERTVLHCNNSEYLLKNHDFVKKIPGVTYDLETANLLTQML